MDEERKLAALRQSAELENRADLCAAGGNFGEAALLMKRANAIRRDEFGISDINKLRELTATALSNTRSGGTSDE